MIKSGGCFFYKRNRCFISAVISHKGLPHIATASHIFKKSGEHVIVDRVKVTVKSIFKDFDLALIEVPSESEFEITELGNAIVLESAFLANEMHTIKCKVINVGASLLYVGFPFSNMFQPGDSGSPIFQAGKVIGFISSICMDNCIGTVISSNILRSFTSNS
ncbi:MAG: serine protease [Methanosarcina sp.]